MAISMRERIANAIVDELGVSRRLLDGVDDDVMAEIREAIADAVLAELETPTDGMVEAVGDECDALGVMLHPKEAAKLIAAAIRAAREGK